MPGRVWSEFPAKYKPRGLLAIVGGNCKTLKEIKHSYIIIINLNTVMFISSSNSSTVTEIID